MKQHLSDQELIDLLHDVAPPEAAAASKRHLQGCQACKRRLKQLRATLGQLELLRGDAAAPEALLARTLQAARARAPGGRAAENETAAAPASGVRPEPGGRGRDLPESFDYPRRNILEFGRFFWMTAAAAVLVAAATVYLPRFLQRGRPQELAMGRLARETAPAATAAPAADLRASKAGPADGADSPAAGFFKAAREAPESDADRLLASDPSDARKEKKALFGAQAPVAEAGAAGSRGSMAPPPAPAEETGPAMNDARVARRAKEAVPKSAHQAGAGADAPAAAVTAPAPPPAAAPAPAIAMTRQRDGAAGGAGGSPRPAPDAAVAAERPAPAKAEGSAGVSALTAGPPRVEFTVQPVAFILPMTSGTWILQQNIRVRASANEDEVRMDVSNHGALPVVFELRPPRGTNVLRRLPLEPGEATHFVHRTKP